MALTRKSLKAMGITDEQVDSIMELHIEVTDSLRKERDGYREKAEKLPDIQKELSELKSKGDGGLQEKLDKKTADYDKLKKEYDDYKADQTAKESKAAKEKAARAYLESKNIKGDNVNIAIRGMGAEIDALELDNGKIKDASALDALIAGDYKGLVTTTTEHNAPPPANPPAGGKVTPTREEILKIKDPSERQAKIAENIDLFRK